MADPILSVHLLGNPEFCIGEQPLPLPTPDRAFALCVYLLLHRSRPLNRDHVAFLLWPDVPEDEARANLRRHLYLLRRQLPPCPDAAPWIVTNRSTIQWNPGARYWLDVDLVDEFRPDAADDQAWSTLLDAYRGELLAGQYDDWVLTERAALHRHFLDLLARRVEAQKATGDWKGAVDTAERMLMHDPLREEPYRWLMELHYRAGDRAAAMHAFERCRAMLRQELGVDPMPETAALADAIVRGHAGHPAPVGVPDSGPPPSPPPAPAAPLPRPAARWQPVAVRLLFALLFLVVVLTLVVIVPRLRREGQPALASLSGPEAVVDTWLNYNHPELAHDPDYGPEPYASYPQVHLQYFGYPYDRVLLRFDLTSLPPGATIQRALLTLHFEPFLNEDLSEALPATISAYRLHRRWEPDSATFVFPWARPGLQPGTDYDAAPLDSQEVGDGWVTLDVTGPVGNWLAHPGENAGVVIMISAAPYGAHYWVDTTDYPLPGRRPRLDISYLP